MTPDEIAEVRRDPRLWFQGFELYRRGSQAQRPCRMAVLKCRRAGAITADGALTYVQSQKNHARLAIGPSEILPEELFPENTGVSDGSSGRT